MPNSEQLQYRLEQFRQAGQNLILEPLATQKKLAKFGVEYQTDLLYRLQEDLEGKGADNKLVFTGHRGCGKSTLLSELRFQLTESDRFFVVMFSISDTIERSAVDHVNILFSTAVQLMDAAERRALPIQPGLRKPIYQWFAKHTKTEAKAVEAEIEVSAKVEAKGGLPVILTFLAEIKEKLKINSVIREEITTEFKRRISELIEKIEDIKNYIEAAAGKPVLVMIDDLDKLDLSVTDTIFRTNLQPLLDPSFRIIYTISIAALRELPIKSNITAYVDDVHIMGAAKFFSRKDVRNPDRIPDAELVDIFQEILYKRLPRELIQPDVVPLMILQSGGLLRELIRIAARCCDKCKEEIGRQLRRSQFDKDPVQINQAVLDQVLIDLQIEADMGLGRSDYTLLKAIYQNLKAQENQEKRFLELLHGLYILEYRNAQLWYDLNPIVRDLLIQEGEIDGPD